MTNQNRPRKRHYAADDHLSIGSFYFALSDGCTCKSFCVVDRNEHYEGEPKVYWIIDECGNLKTISWGVLARKNYGNTDEFEMNTNSK